MFGSGEPSKDTVPLWEAEAKIDCGHFLRVTASTGHDVEEYLFPNHTDAASPSSPPKFVNQPSPKFVGHFFYFYLLWKFYTQVSSPLT